MEAGLSRVVTIRIIRESRRRYCCRFLLEEVAADNGRISIQWDYRAEQGQCSTSVAPLVKGIAVAVHCVALERSRKLGVFNVLR